MSETRFASGGYRKFAWVAAMVLLLLLVPKPSSAQTVGAILGTVRDSSGGVVPQAKVKVVNTDTSDARTVTTGDDGAFRVPALDAGHYSVRVEKEGFKTEIQTGLTLVIAQEMVVNSALQVGTSTQEVTVTGEAPLVNTTNSALGGLVSEDKMADLPLNGRNYTDLAFMQPGINVATNVSSTDTQGGIRGIYFSSDGGAVRSNMITLDGATLMNQRAATSTSASGTSTGVAGIKEYKVVTGAFDASYGQAPGAQVVMISKGGTNQYHGEVFEYLRNSAMDAANFFDKPVLANNFQRLPTYQRNNFGASFGGPIKKDKTFVFAAYEGVRQRLGLTIVGTVPDDACRPNASNTVGGVTTITTAACTQLGTLPGGATSVVIADVMKPILALYPHVNLPKFQVTVPSISPSRTDWGQIRLDQNISAFDTLFGRYTEDKSFLSQGGLRNDLIQSGFSSFSQFITISENHIFSSVLLNQARLSFSRSNEFEDNIYPSGVGAITGNQYSMVPGQPLGSFTLNSFSGFGVGTATPPSIVNTLVLNDDVYYTKGKHSLKFGVAINHSHFAGGTRKYFAGAPTFTSLGNFLKGIPTQYIALSGGVNAITDRNWMYWVPGFYAQDDWRVTQRLTLNLGLRYEFLTVPFDTTGRSGALRKPTDASFTPGAQFAPFSKRAFSPRVGFAWDVQGNGKTSVRGGFGQYYNIGLLAPILFIDVYGQPPLTGIQFHSNTSNAVMQLPFKFCTAVLLPDCPAVDVIGLITTQYDLKYPYMLKWNLAVERQFPWGMGLQVGYVGSRGLHLYQQGEGNPNNPTAVVNGYPYWNGLEPRANPNFASSLFVSSTGASTYHALQVALNKRTSHGFQFQTSYTYSHALDNTQSTSAAECSGASGMSIVDYNGPGSQSFNKGPACFDATHNLRVNLLYRIPDIHSDNFAAKLAHGWWMGSIISAQSGYAFTPVIGTNRSNSQILSGFTQIPDYPNLATAADAAACPAISATCKYIVHQYDPKTVILGTPGMWYDPSMFVLPSMTQTPGGAVCTNTTCKNSTNTALPPGYGTIGNVGRGLLRGPSLTNVDFSINKDTRLPFLGEQGSVVFRVEFFNIFNHPNFNMPKASNFTGAVTSFGPYSETITSSAGQIQATVTKSRLIQLALKVVF